MKFAGSSRSNRGRLALQRTARRFSRRRRRSSGRSAVVLPSLRCPRRGPPGRPDCGSTGLHGRYRNSLKASFCNGVGLASRSTVEPPAPCRRTLVACECGEVCEQGLEAVDGESVGGAAGVGLGDCRSGPARRFDRRPAVLGGFVVVEEQRRKSASRVPPLDVVGEHAQEGRAPAPAPPEDLDRHRESVPVCRAGRRRSAACPACGPWSSRALASGHFLAFEIHRRHVAQAPASRPRGGAPQGCARSAAAA